MMRQWQLQREMSEWAHYCWKGLQCVNRQRGQHCRQVDLFDWALCCLMEERQDVNLQLGIVRD